MWIFWYIIYFRTKWPQLYAFLRAMCNVWEIGWINERIEACFVIYLPGPYGPKWISFDASTTVRLTGRGHDISKITLNFWKILLQSVQEILGETKRFDFGLWRSTSFRSKVTFFLKFAFLTWFWCWSWPFYQVWLAKFTTYDKGKVENCVICSIHCSP